MFLSVSNAITAATDNAGETAVYAAVVSDRPATLSALLAAGAPTEGVSEGTGMTLMVAAAYDDHHECLALLLEHRAIVLTVLVAVSQQDPDRIPKLPSPHCSRKFWDPIGVQRSTVGFQRIRGQSPQNTVRGRVRGV